MFKMSATYATKAVVWYQPGYYTFTFEAYIYSVSLQKIAQVMLICLCCGGYCSETCRIFSFQFVACFPPIFASLPFCSFRGLVNGEDDNLWLS